MQLYEALAMHIAEWREASYQHEEFPAIAEILESVSNPDIPNFRLRKPQLRALETYWYLRLRENTPHIFDLYQSLFPKKKDLLEAFGIPEEAFSRADYDLDTLAESIRNDADFVKEFRFDAVRETILLDYPSYILALADVPERKNDRVQGIYTVEAKKSATVAVKVTDMLGEQVLLLGARQGVSKGL